MKFSRYLHSQLPTLQQTASGKKTTSPFQTNSVTFRTGVIIIAQRACEIICCASRGWLHTEIPTNSATMNIHHNYTTASLEDQANTRFIFQPRSIGSLRHKTNPAEPCCRVIISNVIVLSLGRVFRVSWGTQLPSP